MKKLVFIIITIVFVWFVAAFFYGKAVQWYCNNGMNSREKNIAVIANRGKTSNRQLNNMESENGGQYIQCLNSLGIKAWKTK